MANDPIEPTTTTLPAASDSPVPEPELTLEEHEAQFPSGSRQGVEREPAPREDEAPPAAAQARDDKGQFTEGKGRRSSRQQASPRDVPRINELTRRNKELEEELTKFRNGTGHAPAPAPTPVPPPAPAAPPRAAQPPPSQAQQPPARFQVETPPWDPMPQENDPRYGGDLVRYMQEYSRWSARQEQRQFEFDRFVAGEQQKQRDSELAENRHFAENVERSKARHADFEDVAFHVATPIQKDTIPDIFIRRDDNGPEMLYYLHSHRQELDELLAMSELQQAKFLTLLSQRLSSDGSGLIGGSRPTPSIAQPRTIVLPPKPPNGVRTEAQRSAPQGPPTDRELSMSEHEQYYAPKARR